MDFAQPFWLFIGIGVCVGLLFFFRFMRKKRLETLDKFVAHQLIGRLTSNISARKRRSKNIFILLAIFMCFAALARPQYGFKWVEVKRKGIDLLFALDTSKSMLAEDIKPNRLKRAHLAILDFVRQLEGDRVGLLPFAGSAYLMCPMTLDYNAFEHSLSAVDTNIIPQGGTNIAAVISKATETLDNAANHKILIILTDGEHLQGETMKVAKDAAEKGLTIYTVGVGTSQGELIPLAGGGGQGFIKDKAGNFVTSKLDQETLTQIAEISGGIYVPLGTAGEGLETIYQQKLALIPKEELAERRHKVPLERFEWPLAMSIFFLIVELLIGQRKSTRRDYSFIKTIGRRIRRKNNLTAIVIILALSQGGRSYASQGEDDYYQGDYLQSSEYYSKKLAEAPDDPVLNYNFGTAAYKNNMLDDAIGSFTKALKSDNIELQQKSYYNRGNSHYKKGEELLQADLKTAAEQWQQALDSFDSALKLNPDQAETKHNYDVVKKRLEELEKQLPEEKEQQDQNQQNDQDQQQKNEDGKEGQQGEEQQQSENNEQSSADNQQSDPAKGEEEKAQQQPEPDEKNEIEQAPESAAAENDEKPEDQAAKDAIRQQQGKMTKEEAEQLLNALKNEEGELNFVPRGNSQTEPDKDW